MKKTILNFLSCCLLVAMASCGNSETTEETATVVDSPATEDNQQKARMDVSEVNEIAKCECVIALCQNPGTACGEDCVRDILNCHKIDSLRFDTMTGNYRYEGHVVDTNTIAAVRRPSVDCARSWLKVEGEFTTQHNADIALSLQDTIGTTEKQREAVKYRIPLMRGILDKKPARVLFYKAEKIDCNGNNVKDIVFKLEYNESGKESEFYDLSDAPDKRKKTKKS